MIETFSKQTFEETLPEESVPLGIVGGEYCWLIPVTELAGILVRSSVDYTGESRLSGEDSIRVYPVECQKMNSILGDKWVYRISGKPVGKWITRQKGWEDRMQVTMVSISDMIIKAGECSKCGKPLSILKVKKPGKNLGRWFATCKKECNQFMWLD